MLEFPQNRFKRIRKELSNARESGNEYNLRQIDENEMLRLRMTIKSPEDSVYLGLKIEFHVDLPIEYPFKSPKVRLLTPIRHMLISPKTGVFCISILEVYNWSPAFTITQIAIHAEQELLQTPIHDHVENASYCINADTELIEVARKSLDEYSAIVIKHSLSIINKEVPMRSIW